MILGVVIVALYYSGTRDAAEPPIEALVVREEPLAIPSAPAPEPKVCSYGVPSLVHPLPAGEMVDSPFNRAVTRKVTEGGSGFSMSQVGHNPQFILGYPEMFSFTQGDVINIRYARGIYGEGNYIEKVVIVDALKNEIIAEEDGSEEIAPLKDEPCRSYYEQGCEFTRSYRLAADLPPGSYYAFLTDDLDRTSYPIFFIVTPKQEDLSEYEVLVVYPNYTWQAYNRFGGGSLYGIQIPDDNGEFTEIQYGRYRLYSASMKRPILFDPTGNRKGWHKDEGEEYFSSFNRYDTNLNVAEVHVSENPELIYRVFGYGEEDEDNNVEVIGESAEPAAKGWEQRLDESPELTLPFIRLLIQAGYDVAAISNSDLHAKPSLLDEADILVLTGHDEYWTDNIYRSVKQFVQNGGNIANFAGNIDWGRVNYKNGSILLDQVGGLRKPECNENVSVDFQGTGFLGYHVFPGPEEIFGLAFRFGGYPILEYLWLQVDGYEFHGIDDQVLSQAKGIVVKKAGHPVFELTGLSQGERWGDEIPVLSFEIDGMPLDETGIPDREMAKYLPEQVEILATTTLFAANRVTSDTGREYYGVKSPAVFVEVAPFSDSGGKVISLGSMGFGAVLAIGDETGERIFLNTVDYLSD